MNPKTKANILLWLAMLFMAMGVFHGHLLGLPYWADPIFMFIGVAILWPGISLLKKAQKAGEIPISSESKLKWGFRFFAVLAAVVCIGVPFLMPYVDPA